jgi:dipeptidyl aminopeptidase/acylaminoacyl peptidase
MLIIPSFVPPAPLQGQFWTSRGIAVLDLNYGGGAGFAREYRERLKLNWGIVEADDCVNGAKFLAEQGLVDLRRLVISGGSAGGYTALATLVFRDSFQGGGELSAPSTKASTGVGGGDRRRHQPG